MWRRVLLVLFVVGKGTLAAEGSNQEVYKKLCDITKGVKGLMKQNGEHKGSLQEALYGEKKEDPFVNGYFTGGSRCEWVYPPSRSTYCSHIQPGSTQAKNPGCFGDSILGTLLCTCVRGQYNEQDLCGLGIEQGSTGWGGWNSRPQDLFKKVLEKIKENCTAPNTTVDIAGHLEDLKNAVNEIKNEAKQKNFSNGKDGHYLGSGTTTTRFCDGSSAQDACVTYPEKSGNEPSIPWADKILDAINKARTQQQGNYKNAAITSGPDHHQDDQERSSETDTGNDEEGDEEG
ncbi:Variant surface glycoprotein [Trypanosoma congolense IL3000]|uniref:Variant surface glycoprotein n=1 Tax=Trypanosoma congolense (strain IL3000) TaxID=1068625 RepID=F9WC25_TRYCI|nr:Variant surface glycoprotein [Trypanosoma congolense IL3000]